MVALVPLRLVMTLLQKAASPFASPSEFLVQVFPNCNRIGDGGRKAARRPSDCRKDRF